MLKQKPSAAGEQASTDRQTLGSHVESCPTCDGTVVDGQGLLGCVDCDWLGDVA